MKKELNSIKYSRSITKILVYFLIVTSTLLTTTVFALTRENNSNIYYKVNKGSDLYCYSTKQAAMNDYLSKVSLAQNNCDDQRSQCRDNCKFNTTTAAGKGLCLEHCNTSKLICKKTMDSANDSQCVDECVNTQTTCRDNCKYNTTNPEVRAACNAHCDDRKYICTLAC